MNRRIYRKSVAPHNQRVATDIGIPTDRVDKFIELMNFYEARKDTIKLLYNPYLTGNKVRTSGNLKFVSKGYSANSINQPLLSNDLTQTTWTSQPYLVGNIAPTETLGIKNPNGGSNYLTHPTISFGASDSWSVTTVLNWNGSGLEAAYSELWSDGTDSNKLVLSEGGSFNLRFKNLSNTLTLTSTGFAKGLIGKVICLTICATNNQIITYVNGTLISITGGNTATIISTLLKAGIPTRTHTGQIKHHVITSHAPTSTEVAQEHALLRSIYPDIESVRIGEQTWATSNCEMAATPMGNVIPEMVANSNVEKIVNGGFNTDASWSKNVSLNSTVSISDGVATLYKNAGICNVSQNISVLPTKYYKIIITAKGLVGGEVLRPYIVSNLPAYTMTNEYSTYSFIITNLSGNVPFYFNNITELGTILIDNVSVQEIGWAGSQELYDYIYANTTGTTEQKTYAAVKAAAMWCHYNNSVDNGAIYGKLYNWFAVKLLQMDIDYYNAANPSAMWGWSTPLQYQNTTLAVNGGNVLKVAGNIYWANSNGNNQTGMSLIGTGYRQANGTFADNKNKTGIMCYDSKVVRIANDGDNTFTELIITTEGFPIRLIKV